MGCNVIYKYCAWNQSRKYSNLFVICIIYKILPSINNWSKDPNRIIGGVKVDTNFTYTSDNNNDWMDIGTLKNWIKVNKNKIGKI